MLCAVVDLLRRAIWLLTKPTTQTPRSELQNIRMPMEEEYVRLQQLMDEQKDQHEWRQAPGMLLSTLGNPVERD